jgi:four helix bundle protein
VKQFEDLQNRTKCFALRIIRLYRSLPKTEEARILGKQLLRSGTAVGANYRAACRARSRSEFVAKLGIVLEEADESCFWLELMQETKVFPETKLRDIVGEAKELVLIFVTSVRTAKTSTSSI